MYIYLLQEREFINSNSNIYKIGKTEQENLKRFKNYPNDSKLILHITCKNCHICEKDILKIFREQFIQKKEIGNEYFEGCYMKMMKIIFSYIENEKDEIQVENIKIEKEKIKVEKGKIKVEKEKIKVEKEKIKVDKEKIKVEKIKLDKEKIIKVDKVNNEINVEKEKINNEIKVEQVNNEFIIPFKKENEILEHYKIFLLKMTGFIDINELQRQYVMVCKKRPSFFMEDNNKLLIDSIIESQCLPKNDINFGKYLQSIDNINNNTTFYNNSYQNLCFRMR